MQAYTTIQNLERLHTLVPFSRETFTQFVGAHAEGISDQYSIVSTIVDEVALTVFEDITIDQLLETAILVATQNIQHDTDYDKVASRLLLSKVYLTALKKYNQASNFETLYKKTFVDYITYSVDENLLNPRLIEVFGDSLDELANEIEPERDDVFKFVGITTALKRYMKLDWDQSAIETPQYMWMRIAMWMAIEEEDAVEQTKLFYRKLSNLDYIPGGSTNIGAGTNYPVLSNCYLMDTQDDINSIFDNVKNVAMISKATGGIGISVTKLRASGSPVKSNNTFSTGPIPFINVMDAALKSVSRAGKKFGAVAFYMENWHLDFQDFLDLRQNAGDDYRRIRTGNTAVYISDEFMKRVVNGEDWYLFDPYETPDLTELYGNEFSKKYTEYCEKAEAGKVRMFKKLPAREQMKNIVTTLLSTSHPWLTWKDTINLRALNNNTGTIHCSNLCTEITLPQDSENIAVCNLLYVNLVRHVRETGSSPDDKIDWNLLEETVRVGVRHLDNLVDVNKLTIAEAENSDSKNRAVGMGMSGFAETLEKFGYAYDSDEAFDLIDRLMEFITYHAIDESCNLSDERGAYENFDGSMWSKGFVPFDTIDKVARDRQGRKFNEKLALDAISEDVEATELATAEKRFTNDTNIYQTKAPTDGIERIKSRIKEGIDNARSEESRELYELFEQLASLILSSEANKEKATVQTVSFSSDLVSTENKDLLVSGEGTDLTQNREIRMNWSVLRERVKNGVRNATLMAIAPNASTGLVLGTTPSFDPRFANIFSRSTSTGKFLDINHNLVKDLRELGLWDTVKNSVIEKYGDIQDIEEIPDSIKAVYKTSFQVSPYAYLEVASRAQKWVDQAISRNMYLQTRDVDELVDIYTDAWRRGVKTTYYLHSRPRHKAEQSTVKVNKAKKLNKTGFASAGTTAQQSFDGTQEKKGFGFAAKPETLEKPAKEEITVGSVAKSKGFGAAVKKEVAAPAKAEEMGKRANLQKEQSVKPEPKFNMQACPIDPAERANCEACM